MLNWIWALARSIFELNLHFFLSRLTVIWWKVIHVYKCTFVVYFNKIWMWITCKIPACIQCSVTVTKLICATKSVQKKVSGDCTRKLKVVNLLNINPKTRMRKVTILTYESDFLKWQNFNLEFWWYKACSFPNYLAWIWNKINNIRLFWPIWNIHDNT